MVKMINKKASYEVGGKAIFFVFALFLFTALFFGIKWVVFDMDAAALYAHDDSYINIYVERFIGTPQCFAYEDINTGNVYSGVLDASKFTSERLNSCYIENADSPYEFFLTLSYGNQEKKIATENYNQRMQEYPINVVVIDGGKKYLGKLSIGVDGLSE